jgi:hypothetical protein
MHVFILPPCLSLSLSLALHQLLSFLQLRICMDPGIIHISLPWNPDNSKLARPGLLNMATMSPTRPLSCNPIFSSFQTNITFTET